MRKVRLFSEFKEGQKVSRGTYTNIGALAITGLVSYVGYASGGWISLGYSLFCFWLVAMTLLSGFVDTLQAHHGPDPKVVAENMYLIWFAGTILTITVW